MSGLIRLVCMCNAPFYINVDELPDRCKLGDVLCPFCGESAGSLSGVLAMMVHDNEKNGETYETRPAG